MINSLKNNWYMVYVKTNSEFAAQNSLDVECAVPVVRQIFNTSQGMRSKIVPKFKNYIYVRHDGSSNFFSRVLANEYVSYFLGMTKVKLPEPVSAPEMDLIQTETKKNILNNGDKVLIIDGLWRNFLGTIESKKENFFVVKIPVLDKEIHENIPAEYLVPQKE